MVDLAYSSHRRRHDTGRVSPSFPLQTGVPGAPAMVSMNQQYLAPPGMMYQTPVMPSTGEYVPASTMAEARWSGVTITTSYPGAVGVSSTTATPPSMFVPGTSGDVETWNPAWAAQDLVSGQHSSPSFTSSPAMSTVAFSPSSSGSAASPAMAYSRIPDGSVVQQSSPMMDPGSMAGTQFLSSNAAQPPAGPPGVPPQLAYQWNTGGLVQWAASPALLNPAMDLSGIPVPATRRNGELMHICKPCPHSPPVAPTCHDIP